MMLPPPTATPNSVPDFAASTISEAMIASSSGSVPYWPGLEKPSPEIFRMARRKRGWGLVMAFVRGWALDSGPCRRSSDPQKATDNHVAFYHELWAYAL